MQFYVLDSIVLVESHIETNVDIIYNYFVLLLKVNHNTIKMLLLLFWSFLSKRVIHFGFDVFICGIINSKLWYHGYTVDGIERLLIGIVVCPLFTLNKIRIIINHGSAAWESVAHQTNDLSYLVITPLERIL